jgi:hypothetical protein
MGLLQCIIGFLFCSCFDARSVRVCSSIVLQPHARAGVCISAYGDGYCEALSIPYCN